MVVPGLCCVLSVRKHKRAQFRYYIYIYIGVWKVDGRLIKLSSHATDDAFISQILLSSSIAELRLVERNAQ